ncbi:MAG: quinate 5-dehydrogenase, partial [Candidatus Eremiobacterota bacterium]
PVEKYHKYYEEASIIAGDYHFIRKYMPLSLSGKIIITNTITPFDIEELKKRHVSKLITTTPDIQGRSFGTNVLEAVLMVLIGKTHENITDEDYLHLIKELHILPRIENFVY